MVLSILLLERKQTFLQPLVLARITPYFTEVPPLRWTALIAYRTYLFKCSPLFVEQDIGVRGKEGTIAKLLVHPSNLLTLLEANPGTPSNLLGSRAEHPLVPNRPINKLILGRPQLNALPS